MKKYNRSEIFKRMWQLVKNENMTRSTALALAWKEARKKMNSKNEILAVLENSKEMFKSMSITKNLNPMNDFAESITNSIDFPQLKGTQKQIAYADKIRKQHIRSVVLDLIKLTYRSYYYSEIEKDDVSQKRTAEKIETCSIKLDKKLKYFLNPNLTAYKILDAEWN